jgi:hypothetical protein
MEFGLGVGYEGCVGVPVITTLPFGFDEASPSVRLRVVRDLWDAKPPEPLIEDVLSQREVRQLTRTQRRDGTWASWLHRAGVSTENAVTRLAELGCPADRPPLSLALPRILALLAGEPAPFVDLRRPAPRVLLLPRLRRVAAGLLAQVGLGENKVVREVVEHEVDRAHAWARVAREGGVRVKAERSAAGRRELTVVSGGLDDDGIVIPDLYWLRAVAFTPELRDDPRVREILRVVAEPDYQQLAEAGLGLIVVDGQRVRPGFPIRRSDPEQAVREQRLGELLVVAELLARVGDPGPARRAVRFLDEHADERGRVTITSRAFRRGGGYAIQRGWVRLALPWRASARVIDLTFRKLLLDRLSAA